MILLYSFTVHLIWYGTVIVYLFYYWFDQIFIQFAVCICLTVTLKNPVGEGEFLIRSIFENGYEIMNRIQHFNQVVPTWRTQLLVYSINWLEYTQDAQSST